MDGRGRESDEGSGEVRWGRRKNDPRYGKGQHTIVEGSAVLMDEEELCARIRAVFESPAYQPPVLPNVAVELMAISRDPEVALADVVALLERDAMLASRVLTVVQSPIYAGAAKVTSLRDAVSRLGLRTIRGLVLEIAMNLRVFKSAAYAGPMERLRRHSSAVAHVARIVSRYTPMDAEYAFLCGLLHDVTRATRDEVGPGGARGRRG